MRRLAGRAWRRSGCPISGGAYRNTCVATPGSLSRTSHVIIRPVYALGTNPLRDDVTYGAGGFRVPPFNFTLLGIAPPIVLFSLTWLTTLVAFLCCWNVIHSRYGRAFAAVRDGETAAQSLGLILRCTKAWHLEFPVYSQVLRGLFTLQH